MALRLVQVSSEGPGVTDVEPLGFAWPDAADADVGQGDVPWTVLADPEGNEFCVLTPG
jgi:hypothetical protein